MQRYLSLSWRSHSSSLCISAPLWTLSSITTVPSAPGVSLSSSWLNSTFSGWLTSSCLSQDWLSCSSLMTLTLWAAQRYLQCFLWSLNTYQSMSSGSVPWSIEAVLKATMLQASTKKVYFSSTGLEHFGVVSALLVSTSWTSSISTLSHTEWCHRFLRLQHTWDCTGIKIYVCSCLKLKISVGSIDVYNIVWQVCNAVLS